MSVSVTARNSTAAPRPAARDQRPRRGLVRLSALERQLNCPRNVRCCRCATDAASLHFFVIAVPSSPCADEGRRGNFKWGEEEAVGTSGWSRQGEVRGVVLVSLERCLCLRWCSLLGQFSPRQLSLAKHERAGVGCHRVRDSVGDGKGRVRE